MSATGVGNQDKYCEPDTKHTTPHTSTAIEPLHCTSLVSGYLHVEFNMLSRAGDQLKQRTLRDLVSARITNVSAHLFADGSIKDKLISYPAVHLLLLICIWPIPRLSLPESYHGKVLEVYWVNKSSNTNFAHVLDYLRIHSLYWVLELPRKSGSTFSGSYELSYCAETYHFFYNSGEETKRSRIRALGSDRRPTGVISNPW